MMEMQRRRSQHGSEDAHPAGLSGGSPSEGSVFLHCSKELKRWGVALPLLFSPEELGCCKSNCTSGKGAWTDTIAPNNVRLETRTLTSARKNRAEEEKASPLASHWHVSILLQQFSDKTGHNICTAIELYVYEAWGGGGGEIHTCSVITNAELRYNIYKWLQPNRMQTFVTNVWLYLVPNSRQQPGF